MNKRLWIFPAIAVLAVILIFVVSKKSEQVSPEKESRIGTPGETDAVSEEIDDSTLKPGSSFHQTSSESSASWELSWDEPTSDSSGMLRIFGVVKKENGVPLAGADLWAIVIENISEQRMGEEKGRTFSDDNGDYQMKVPNGSDYMVYAGAKGYALKQSPALWRQAGVKKEIRLDFVLSAGMTIKGKVKDTEGNVISGVAVSPSFQQNRGQGYIEAMQKQITPSILSVQTDESGDFILEGLYPGFYTLAAVKEGFSPTLKRDVPSPSENVEIIMEKGEGGIIAGNVFYFSSGEAAEGAVVKVRSLPFVPEGIVMKTGSQGDFRFSGLIQGVYEIDAEKDGMQSMPYSPIDLLKSKEKNDVILKLFNGYTISGHVYEEKGMKVVSGVEVSIRAGFDEEGSYEISDQEGYYQISGIFSKSIFIFGELEGYFHVGDSGPNSPKRLDLPADIAEVKNVDLIMCRGVRVSGRVVTEANKDPISGATVKFITDARVLGKRLKPMITDSEGVFSGYVQNHTRFTIRASHSEYADGSTNPIAVSEKPIENIQIELGKGGNVRGLVVSPEKEPVAGARVRGSAPAASVGARRRAYGQKQAVTDSEGRFLMERVPAGEFYVSATADGYSPSANRLVSIPEGGEAEEVTIVLSASFFIEGFVRDESGEPVVGAKIMARNINRASRIYTSASEPGGNFRLEGIVKGKYRVNASKEDMASRVVEAEQNSTNVELILKEREFTSLNGRVVDSETREPVEHFKIRAEFGGKNYGNFDNPEGAFFIEELVRGRKYRFYIESSGYVTTLSPYVLIPKEGEVPEAEFHIGRGGAVFGRVLYSINKSPVKGAKITCILTSRLQRNPRTAGEQVSYTGKDGAFLYEGLTPGEYTIKVEKTGYPELVSECNVKDGEVTDIGELLLKASGRIRGRVLDKQDPPQPVPDKIVNLSSIDTEIPIQISYKTGGNGVYVFKDLPEGKYSIRPVGNEYNAVETLLKPGEIKTIQFRPK